MNKKNPPLKSTSHIVSGSWFVYRTDAEIIRLHSSTFGKLTVYINEEEIESFINLKSSFKYDFEKNGHSFSINMKTESHAKTENVTTFHKDHSIVKIFKSSYKYTFKQIRIIIIPVVIITIISTILEASNLLQYSLVFIWLIFAIIYTGKDYLNIIESDNPNFE
ncbi:MAG: hypothetical protein ACI8Q1_001414 [Parvicella sp.]